MKYSVEWTRRAAHDLQALPSSIARRVVIKVEWYAMQEKPLSFAKRLHHAPLGSYRFEIGNYRATFDVRDGIVSILSILSVKHRKDVYKEI